MIQKCRLPLLLSLLLLTGCDNIKYTYHKLVHSMGSQDPAAIAPFIVETEKATIEVVTLQTDFYLPWAVTALPDNTLLITEKPGALYHFNPASGKRTSIRGLPATKHWGQGGLMDIVAHPDFNNNRLVYFSYAGLMEGKLAATRVARGKLVGDQLNNVEILFTAKPAVKSGAHFGAALVFDDNGYLFITSGERGQRPMVQDLSTHLGKVIRLHDDGRVPVDNPFIGVEGALPEIYSYGHRNPQGIAVEPVSREIWSVEHGPMGGDEVNIIRPGRNYGWPVISMGKEYGTGLPIGEGTAKPGMEPALRFYVPSIATSGMRFYTGSAFAGWQGNLLIGALSFTHINRLEINQGQIVHEERMLKDLKHRIRDVEQGADGFLYVLTDGGQLLQLKPAPDS